MISSFQSIKQPDFDNATPFVTLLAGRAAGSTRRGESTTWALEAFDWPTMRSSILPDGAAESLSRKPGTICYDDPQEWVASLREKAED